MDSSHGTKILRNHVTLIYHLKMTQRVTAIQNKSTYWKDDVKTLRFSVLNPRADALCLRVKTKSSKSYNFGCWSCSFKWLNWLYVFCTAPSTISAVKFKLKPTWQGILRYLRMPKNIITIQALLWRIFLQETKSTIRFWRHTLS